MSMGKGGKGCSKGCKRTPEQHGFQAKGKLYIRPSQLKRALSLDFSAGLEISNLQRPEVLPPGSASVEVLCSRQSILGNPFCMQRDGGDEESASVRCIRGFFAARLDAADDVFSDGCC